MNEKIADGIYVIHPRKSLDGRLHIRSASIVLYHGKTAAVVEAPERVPGNRAPWLDVKSVIGKLKVKPRYLLFSHSHWDHAGGYMDFRETFPSIRAVWHKSFFKDRYWGFYRERVSRPGDKVFSSVSHVLDLDGEPLLLLHAPKHSESDVLIFFRGTVITGDWTLGAMPDCNTYVPVRLKVKALKGVKKCLLDKHYYVHSAVSAHGNDIRHGIDFLAMVDEMIDYWSEFGKGDQTGRAGWFRRLGKCLFPG